MLRLNPQVLLLPPGCAKAFSQAIIRPRRPRSMKVVQLICNHQVAVRFRSGAPEKSDNRAAGRDFSSAASVLAGAGSRN